MDKKHYRYIVIDTLNGDRFLFGEIDIKKLFEGFNLPVPTIQAPVLSLSFRDAINKYGIANVSFDGDKTGIMEYIPPAQISRIKFYVSVTPLDEEQLINGKPVEQLLKG